MVDRSRERISEWMQKWSEHEWGSAEWRQYVISLVSEGEKAQDELNKIEPLYEEQARYIKHLERQLELLQKTLDIVEKISRPIFIPGDSGGIK